MDRLFFNVCGMLIVAPFQVSTFAQADNRGDELAEYCFCQRRKERHINEQRLGTCEDLDPEITNSEASRVE